MGDAQSTPPWPVARKHRRAPLNVRLEIQQAGRTFRGRAANIGEGGILIVTPFTFPPYTELVIHFTLPSGVSIEALGVVRHRKAGAHMGLMFLELNEAARNAIAEHVSKTQPHHRRGARVARRFDVVLRWDDLEGAHHEEPAYTLLVSRHGGSAACSHRFKAGEDAFLWWPEQNRGAAIRIVFRQLGRLGDLAEVGFEFKDVEHFWPLKFPPDPFS